MKVHITFEKNEHGKTCIDRVFKNKGDARCYVVTESMIENTQNGEELKELIDAKIETHEIIMELNTTNMRPK